MKKQVGAIITGGDFQGLAVLRSLGSRGIPIVLVDNEISIGKYSKYKKKCFKSPPPHKVDEYCHFLINLIKSENLYDWVIFPNSDQIVYNISKHAEVLSRFIKVPVPNLDVIDNVYNKNNTYKICAKNNIPIPKTYFSENLDELLSLDLQYPLVIKPAIRDHFYSIIKKKAYRVNNQNELIKTYELVNSVIKSDEILVQEFINGGPKNLYSFCPFIKNGQIIASVTARRSRQHPMDFGHATTFAEVVEIPLLQELAEKFLRLINYYGICEVEFMYDENENNYKLIEVNPRVWGWHSLAIAAGADLPYLLYLDMIGEKLPEKQINKNLKWIRLTTDTITVAKEIFGHRMKIADYLTSIKGQKEFAVFSKNDPLPFFAELMLIPYLWKKRGF